MRAQRIVETPVDTGDFGTGRQAFVSAPEAAARDLRVAADGDLALGSPVHAMHAQLAQALEPGQGLRPDPVRIVVTLLAVVYTAAAWWGLASLGSALVHHWTQR